MCGIAGCANWGDINTIEAMTDTLSHRGPDDKGVRFFREERVGLGHRRLSIIDLSQAGHQPMSNEDGSVWVIANGEIYNFRDLRSRLEKAGHKFSSGTDTEVILHQYEEEKSECISRFNGMFSFALLDRRNQKLLLARDRLGIKPLYYYSSGGRLVFASEIKAILESGLYSPLLNQQGLYDYFTYLYVPCPETIFQGIFQLAPANAMEVDLDTQAIKIWQYWNLADKIAQVSLQSNNNEMLKGRQEMLRSLLFDSVKLQMVSDVAVGVFLSGGIDSSIITGLMAEASSSPVKTFTVLFQGAHLEFYNERKAAKAISEKFATEHHEITVDVPDPRDMFNLVKFFDQPFGNPTFYLMYLISGYTRSEVSVALCGAGGDELFAGYPRYRAAALARRLKHFPPLLLSATKKVLAPFRDNYRTMTLRRMRRFLEGLNNDPAEQFVNWTYFFNTEQKKKLLDLFGVTSSISEDRILPSDRIVRKYLDDSRIADLGNRMLYLDTQTFLLDNILEYTDKMTMAHGLECRVPYLDHKVVEYSFSIPFHYKLRGRNSKIILKDAFLNLLPEGNRSLPKKGFNAPLAMWMRDCLDSYFDRQMDQSTVKRQGIFNWEYIRFLRREHQAGKRDNSYELFSIIIFDVWYRRYMLKAKVPEFVW